MSDAGRQRDSAEHLPESADSLPEPPEERADRPAAPPAEQDEFYGPGYGLSGGSAAAIARGVMPPDEPAAAPEPDPRTGPETMPSGAEPRDAERR